MVPLHKKTTAATAVRIIVTIDHQTGSNWKIRKAVIAAKISPPMSVQVEGFMGNTLHRHGGPRLPAVEGGALELRGHHDIVVMLRETALRAD